MACETFVVVIDTPSIKNYVFSTDPLNEVRGASARLDTLNRYETEKYLADPLGKGRVECIYANGGSAQFLIHESDQAGVRAACESMVQHIREQTGGEVGVVYGIAPLKDNTSYTDYAEAVQMAHFQLRCQREFATSQRSAALIPLMMECDSASYLPAADIDNNDGDILSHASYEKRQHGSDARRHGLWREWMEHLKARGQSWPSDEYWDKLRCESLTKIGDCSSWDGYIGLVYADGNSMGKIIKALDLPETYRQFSRIVDESIREACFTALNQVSKSEINNVQESLKNQKPFKFLPADILLLRHQCERLALALGFEAINPHAVTPEDRKTLVKHFTPLTNSTLIVDRLFGNRYQGECLFITNAMPVSSDAENKPVVQTRTAMDRVTGTVMEQHLFTTELVEGKINLRGQIRGRHPAGVLTPDEKGFPYEYALLVAGILSLETLGGDKSTGLGRCKVKLEGDQLCWNGDSKNQDDVLQSFEEKEWQVMVELLRDEQMREEQTS